MLWRRFPGGFRATALSTFRLSYANLSSTLCRSLFDHRGLRKARWRNGRRTGLKIPGPQRVVRVQVPSWLLFEIPVTLQTGLRSRDRFSTATITAGKQSLHCRSKLHDDPYGRPFCSALAKPEIGVHRHSRAGGNPVPRSGFPPARE
jgi:hypothetical protein